MNRFVAAAALAALPASASALDILLTNDDGLTSNVIALEAALEAAGHNVVVSVPCTGQSGMGAAMKFLRPIAPLAEACLNNAAQPGDAGAGPVTKEGDFANFSYVMGTPVMATAYGLDVAAPAAFGRAPDLVLSGPNEGQNVGAIVISSGTVSNAQFAAARGLPAIALSAGQGTAGAEDEAGNHAANPASDLVAAHSVELLALLAAKAGTGPILPDGVALNVNFPDALAADTPFAISEIGDYSAYDIAFYADISTNPAAAHYGMGEVHLPAIGIDMNAAEPTEDQMDDESVVYRAAIAVTPMQVAYDAGAEARDWLSGVIATDN